MRFPGEDVSVMTMQQLRGIEGGRVRKIYRETSKQWNIPPIPRARGGDPSSLPHIGQTLVYSPPTRG